MGSACGGQATATVKGNTTAEQDHNTRWAKGKGTEAPTPANSAAAYVDDDKAKRDPNNPLGFTVAPPAKAEGIDGEAAQMRRAAQRLLGLAGRGRREAFLGTGYGGALSGGNTVGSK